MDSFVYQSLPLRVVFGEGTSARLTDEADLLAVRRALVLTTPGHERLGREIGERLGDRFAGLFAGAVMHTPVGVTDEALKRATDLRADGVVAVGGGSTIGLGKAIALRTGLPQIAIPTTYAGSEMTPILGQTQDGVKTTQSAREILPKTVIYDVDLTLSLPARIAAVSGMNAMAHAVEAMYARDRNPAISLMASGAIRALAGALPAIVGAPDDRNARSQALYGAWLCGVCLGSVGMALHHKLCHVLGGTYNLPHAGDSRNRAAACDGLQLDRRAGCGKADSGNPRNFRSRCGPLRVRSPARRSGGLARDRHAGGRHRRGRRSRHGQSVLESASAST